MVAKLFRRKLRWRTHLSHSPVHRATANAGLRRASLAALYIPALNGGVFRAIRDKLLRGVEVNALRSLLSIVF